MMTNKKSILEYGHLSVNHYGEELCGDHVQVAKGKDGAITLVLADGIGSGVVASILSTLTSSLLSKMIEGGISIEECVETLAKALPVAKSKGNVAYSTFTICRIEPDFTATIFNFDNPQPIFIRSGKEKVLHYEEFQIDDKHIFKANCYFDDNDCLVMVSDGTMYAGDKETINFGWSRDEIVSFMEALYNSNLSAKNYATYLVDQCDMLYDRKPGDDTTCLVVKRRLEQPISLMVGPATNKEDDISRLETFFSNDIPHIVCGGTTAKIVANYLGVPIEGGFDIEDEKIPPISTIKGVDLVTEGVITLNRVLELAKDYLGQNKYYFDWSFKQDGASRLAKMLFEEATTIHFSVGCAVNPAHQNGEDGIDSKMKMLIINSLCKDLKSIGKTVTVTYY